MTTKTALVYKFVVWGVCSVWLAAGVVIVACNGDSGGEFVALGFALLTLILGIIKEPKNDRP